ncbi:MAG: hypothetical protein R3305_05505 [Gammaproteobacteria bacterium]|nr:hypothetical protein [Gammaproteobacteria bacterium]
MAGFALAGLALADPALAEEPAQADEAVTEAPVETRAAPETVSLFEAAEPLSESELTAQRAMARIDIDNITINTTDQDGQVSGNTAAGNTTGHNTIADHAFTGADGFVTTVQNTGNNVLIQNSTTINVSLEQ